MKTWVIELRNKLFSTDHGNGEGEMNAAQLYPTKQEAEDECNVDLGEKVVEVAIKKTKKGNSDES